MQRTWRKEGSGSRTTSWGRLTFRALVKAASANWRRGGLAETAGGFYSHSNHTHTSHLSWCHKPVGAISWMRKGNIKTFNSKGHVTLFKSVFIVFSLFPAQNHDSFSSRRAETSSFLFNHLKPKFSLHEVWSLWFLYLALLFFFFQQMIRWWDSPPPFNVNHFSCVKFILVLCRNIFNLKENFVCRTWSHRRSS